MAEPTVGRLDVAIGAKVNLLTACAGDDGGNAVNEVDVMILDGLFNVGCVIS